MWAALVCAAQVGAQEKYALVIGNGAYTAVPKLKNPVNDANDMKGALEGLGFQVDLLTDAGLMSMESAIGRFRRKLEGSQDAYGFLFYAGHGVQAGSENYLIPVDADIQSESYLRLRAVPVQVMLDELNEAGNALNVVVLDACRDNPFSWNRSGSRGLKAVGNQPADSIIVYATSAGSTAADGEGRNGLFTEQLLKNLKTSGLDVNEVFRRTGGDVIAASGDKQRPAIYSQFFGTAYLGAQPVAQQTRPVPAPQQTQAAAYAGMVRVPAGTFMMGSNGGDDDETPHRVTISKAFYIGKYEVTQKEWRDVMGTTVRQQQDKAAYNFGLAGEGDDYPMYYVSWLEAVEYCNRRSEKEGLSPAYTVSGSAVTWNRGANGYRLPTEAEWEYAAKGGGSGTYDYAGSNDADSVAWYSSNSGNSTHPVGTKAANSLGIYDMSGNVYEWCWDWYDSYGSGSVTDPIGAASGSYRVNRGGGWLIDAQYVRSAFRARSNPANGGSDGLGFRVVRP
jgi:formylglycine-generating enzyme required for sulfatase activity